MLLYHFASLWTTNKSQYLPTHPWEPTPIYVMSIVTFSDMYTINSYCGLSKTNSYCVTSIYVSQSNMEIKPCIMLNPNNILPSSNHAMPTIVFTIYYHNILSRHFIAIEKERDQLITIIFANIAQSYILINGYFLVRNQAPPIFSS